MDCSPFLVFVLLEEATAYPKVYEIQEMPTGRVLTRWERHAARINIIESTQKTGR
jgi:hypothetical protein